MDQDLKRDSTPVTAQSKNEKPRRSLNESLRKFFKEAALVSAATLVLILLAEMAIRIVYHVRNSRVESVPVIYTVRNLGFTPPWMNELRILEPDERLLWKGRPNARRKYLDVFSPVRTEEDRIELLRRFSPSIPDSLRDNPAWELSLNSEGFRDIDFPAAKPDDTVRIVCLGDSWTFGANVNQGQSYPQRLQAMLREDFPQKRIEVFNLGMLGYSSYQGLELLQSRALSLDPDIVIVGFAMNDSTIAGRRDKDRAVLSTKGRGWKSFLVDHMESYKLLWYLGRVKKFGARTMGDYLKEIVDPAKKIETYEGWSSTESLAAEDYDKLEALTRVSPQDYENNLREMIRLIRDHGAAPILVHNELRPGSPYEAALKKVADNLYAPLINSADLIGTARRQIEVELEERFKLQVTAPVPSSAAVDEIEIVFRVYMGEQRVPQAVYITGPYPQLGDAVPNRVAMYDDGTHGDQRAGDNVWSLAVNFTEGAQVFYVYTNSGRQGLWENLDVPKIRSLTVPVGIRWKVYEPVESFGKIYMQADGWHTNASGYELIARAVADELERHNKFKNDQSHGH
jgi:lysophospholipase L1-like esterase